MTAHLNNLPGGLKVTLKSLFAATLLLIACVFALPAFADEDEGAMRINREEIQSAVMGFADTWASVSYEVASQLKKNVKTPAASLHADRFRFYSTAAVFDIAASPYPGVSLLDMMVLTMLTRRVWEEHWLPDVYHEAARPVLSRLQQFESELWTYAASVLTAEQIKAVREAINEWRAQHPDQVDVVFVRFSSFGALGRNPSLEKAREAGGLLGPVKEAAAAADEIRALGDRALFLMVRMQELLSSRVEMSIKEILRTPEIHQLLDNINGFEQNADLYAVLIAALPDEIAGATGETLTDILGGISIERQAAINQLLSGIALERYILMQGVERLVQRSEHEAEAMTTHVFVLLVAVVLLIFMLWLVIRSSPTRQSPSWRGTLGAGVTLIIIAALILVAALAYVYRTRSELPTLPPAAATIEPAGEDSRKPAPLLPKADPGNEVAEDSEILSIQALFVMKSVEVNPQFYPALDTVAVLLKNDPQLRVEVVGHTDSRGEAKENQALSEQRADSVAQYMEQAGIDAGRIQVRALGASQPVAGNDTATGRARNRRVEIVVVRPGS
jgi:outer membrane protein OmpA-like peptidoglycan-associated protein